jgi:hypothetical protein
VCQDRGETLRFQVNVIIYLYLPQVILRPELCGLQQKTFLHHHQGGDG